MRIISYDDVCAGRIPTRQNFHGLYTRVESVLCSSDCIEAALCLGSVAYGHSNPTSDFDVLVICTDTYFENGEAANVLASLSEYAYDWHIPLAWIFTPLSVARDAAKHPWEYSFMKSMEWSGNKNGIIKGDPIGLMGMRNEDMLLYTREYVRRKMNKFRNAIPDVCTRDTDLLSEERKRILLGDVYSFPVHAARKVLQCAGYAFPDGDGKGVVCKEYQEFFRGDESVALFDKLLTVREEYVSALLRIMDGDTSTRSEYRVTSQLNPDVLLLVHTFGNAILSVLTDIEKQKTAQ